MPRGGAKEMVAFGARFNAPYAQLDILREKIQKLVDLQLIYSLIVSKPDGREQSGMGRMGNMDRNT